MLPFVTRNRKVSTASEEPIMNASEMISKIRKSSFRISRISLKAKCCFLIMCVLSIYIYGSIYLSWGENSLKKEDFLEVKKCPACYGRSKCFELFDDQYELSGMSKYRALDMVNIKNVHFAEHKRRGHKIVLKKLAHNSEIKTVDDTICKDSFRNPGCDLSRTFALTKTAQDIYRNGLLPEHFQDSTFMFLCPTHKLIDRMLKNYQEKSRPHGELSLDDKLQILYTAKVNSEPLLIQTFPASEGWPFPEYYGACGRFVAIEYGGKTLGEFYNAPWNKRADLAYQMLKIAQRLTSDPEWALYWTDLAYENFAVDGAGKLYVIDLENIIVVDKVAGQKANKETWNILAESKFDECDERLHSKNCLTFDVAELCSHHEADHNYYTTCRNMLSQYADDEYLNRMDGLLHDMPNYAKDDWDLENLLNECARPSVSQGRVKAVPRLIEALDNLRNVQSKVDNQRDNRL